MRIRVLSVTLVLVLALTALFRRRRWRPSPLRKTSLHRTVDYITPGKVIAAGLPESGWSSNGSSARRWPVR